MRRLKTLAPIIGIFSFLLLMSCREQNDSRRHTLLRRVDPGQSGIDFSNNLEYSEQLNPYTFRNFYNGGGVGLGDLNNDGLLEVFFSGNMVSNRLYLNKGNLQFTDITESAGLASEGSWTTGVSLVDINGDGLLDIYLCKSGP